MSFKSEIKKHFWQDFSLQRVMVPPFLITAIICLIFLSSDRPYDLTSYISFTSYCIINFLWGGLLVASSITDEIRNGTWDNQRLSPVSPWSITFGKLFASTLYTWCLSIFILIIGICASLFSPNDSLSFLQVTTLVLSGFTCHCVTLLVSVQSINANDRSHKKFSAISALSLGLITSSAFYANSLSTNTISWFHFELNTQHFILASLLLFLTWSIIAIYRLLREELMFKNIPWIWGLFVLFIMFYTSGFFSNMTYVKSIIAPSNISERLGSSLLYGIFSIYLMLFIENLKITHYKILLNAIKEKSLKKIGEHLPKWFVSLFISFIVGILFCISLNKMGGIILVITSFFFILRDICIIHYFKLSPKNSKRTGSSILLCFAILYMLIPSLTTALHLDLISAFFLPYLKPEPSLIHIIPSILSFLVARALLRMKWKHLKQICT